MLSVTRPALAATRSTAGPGDDRFRTRDGEADRITCDAGNDVAILDNVDVINCTYGDKDAQRTIALAGGADGMDLVRRILREAPKHMTVDAVLVLEIGNERANFEAAFPHLEAVWLDTSAGDDQVLLLTREALS